MRQSYPVWFRLGRVRIIPSVASHFVKAEIKHFNYDDKDRALEWLVVSC